MSSIGPKIEIAGEAEFKKTINDINTSLKTMGTEMKAVTSAYDRNDKSSAKLTAQNQVLNKQIDAQKQKVSDLKEMVDKSTQAYGENDARTQKYQQQLNSATAALNKSELQLRSNNEALGEYANEAKKATWQTQEFKDKTEKMGQSLKDIGSKVAGLGKTLSVAVTAPLMAAGVASFKFAADLEDAMGASDQIFKSASDNMRKWADNLSSQYGIAETEALAYANTMGAMLQNIGGLSEQEAAKQSQTLVELAGDLTAMFGGTTESAVQALTGALKGNNAMLDNYGMGVNDATIKAKALEMGIYSGTGAMDLQAKQAATLALIMEQTADAQGQAAREAEGASGSLRSMQTELKNLATDIGEVLLPILTPLIASLRDIVERFGELSPEAQKTIVVVAGLAAALGPLLIVIGSAISAVGTITAALPALGAAFAVITGPVGIVVAAVAALVAGIVVLWNTNEGFRNAVIAAWEGIVAFFTQTVPALISNIGAWFAELPAKISAGLDGAIAKAREWGNNAVSTMRDAALSAVVAAGGALLGLPGAIWGVLVSAAQKFVDWKGDISGKARGTIGFVKETVITTISTLPETLYNIGVNVIQGFWNGMKSVIDGVTTKVKNFVQGVKNAVAGAEGFDTQSPSRWAKKIGSYVVQGLAQGLSANKPALVAARKTAADIKGVITNEIEKINNEIARIEEKAAKRKYDEEFSAYKESLADKNAELLKAGTKDKQKILDDIAKIEDDWNKKQNEKAETATKDKLNAQLKSLQDFKTEYDNALKEIENSEGTMSKKLADFGGLFERTQNKLGKDVFKINDLQKDIDAINAYGEALESLKDRGVSDSLLKEIESMGVDDALDYTKKLLSKTDDNYEEYMTLWEEKQAAAKRVASKFYQDEMDSLQAEFVDKIPEELSGTKDAMRDIGVYSGQGLADGFKSQAAYIKNTFVSVLESAMASARASMDINSPSEKWADLVGAPMAQGLGKGFTEQMSEVTRQIRASIPTTIESPTVKMGEGIVNGLAGIMPQQNSQPIIIQLVADGKTLAQTVYDPLNNIARQKGVPAFG